MVDRGTGRNTVAGIVLLLAARKFSIACKQRRSETIGSTTSWYYPKDRWKLTLKPKRVGFETLTAMIGHAQLLMELKTSDSLTGAAEVFGNSYQCCQIWLGGTGWFRPSQRQLLFQVQVIAGTRLVDHPN